MNNTQQLLVSYARKIAVYRGYADLVNGLQSAARLEAKLLHEQEELQEAQAEKSRLHAYHEAADILYYAACLQEQEQGKAARFDESRAWLRERGLDPAKAERAAMAKYGWRAGGPNRKDEAYELRLLVPVLYRLVIFDVDGTLVTTRSGATFRQSAGDWQWLPGRLERCQELAAQGVKLALASNQGGVAFGHLDPDAIQEELSAVGSAIGACSVVMCFTHPNAPLAEYRQESPLRKPGPGMLLRIMETEQIAPADALMVGDRSEDEQAARNADIDFLWAQQFFGEGEK